MIPISTAWYSIYYYSYIPFAIFTLDYFQIAAIKIGILNVIEFATYQYLYLVWVLCLYPTFQTFTDFLACIITVKVMNIELQDINFLMGYRDTH